MNFFIRTLLYKALPIILIISDSVFSQIQPYYNYTPKDGLCNSNVYFIHQDKNGFMWFATDNGISRFDGNIFNNFYTSEGLNSNSFTSIAEGRDSVLYFANYDKGINTYKNGKISKYEIDSNISFLIHSMLYKNDTIYIYSSNYLNVINNHKIKPFLNHFELGSFQSNKPTEIKKIYKVFSFNDENAYNEIWIATTQGIYTINRIKMNYLKIEGLKDSIVYGIAECKDKSVWLGGNGELNKVYNKKVIKSLKIKSSEGGKIYKLFSDSRGNLWFHPVNNGLYFYDNQKIINIGEKIGIGKTPVTCFYEDNEGNVWVSTSGKGVFCFHHLYMTNYLEQSGLSNNNITSILVTKDGKKIIGTFDGINIYNDTSFVRIITGNEDHFTNYIFELKNRSDKIFVHSTYKPYLFSRNINGVNFVFISAISSCIAHNDSLITGGTTNFIYYNDLNEINSFNARNFDFVYGERADAIKISEIETDKDGALWIGTSNGLCKKNGNKKTFFSQYKVLSGSINKIEISSSGNVWVAGENGFAVILKNEEKIIELKKLNNYDFSSSTSFDFDNDSNIWIGNLKGLYKIAKNSFLNDNLRDAAYFNEKNGLPVNDVHSVAYDGIFDVLWIGTISGLTKIKLKEIDDLAKVPAKVLITGIELKDTILTRYDNIVLEPNQNSFQVNFSSVNLSSPKSIKYEFKFEDKDENWIETENRSIDFNSLDYGKYNLLIRAKNHNNVKGEITNLRLEILTPFFKNKLVRITIYLFVILIVYVTVHKKIKFIKKRNKESLERLNSISELRHKALSSTMNPHFIFNTLNSIQHYMNVHNKEDANEYLVNFARLIRMNLDSAGETLIPLELELKRLELYLKYENLRFEDKLKYIINIKENINPKNLYIPNMILQPFVENSIWHGLLPKKGIGFININISREDKIIENKKYKTISIEILDDGIGMSESLNHKISSHISKGINIIKDRLELLSPNINNFEFIMIQDREDNIKGTLVSITLIPPQYKIE